MKFYGKWVLTYMLISIVITLLWQGYELLVYGELRQDLFDSIVALVLSMSLLMNIFFIRLLKK